MNLLAISTPIAQASDIDQARSLLHTANPGRCAKLVEAALKKTPNSPEWLELAAQCLYPGYSYAQRALSLAPNDAQAAAICALLACNQNDCARALYMAGAALQRDHRCGLAYAVISVCKAHSSDAHAEADALKAAEQAVKLSPNDYEVNRLAQKSFEEVGRIDESEKCFQRMCSFYPNSPEVWLMMAKLKRRNGDGEAAIACFDKAIDLRPKDTSALATRARLLQDMGKHSAAKAGFEQWVKIDPGSCPAQYFLGTEFEHDGNAQKAIDCYTKGIAIANRPKPPDKFLKLKSRLGKREYMWCWLKRMQLLEQIGRVDEALAQVNAILAADEYCDAALDIRERILMKKGHYAEAIQDLSKLITLDNDVSDWYKTRGNAYAKLNKQKEAAEDLAKAKHIDDFGF
jgi:tetratricopeptide (TPR) repeat protein